MFFLSEYIVWEKRVTDRLWLYVFNIETKKQKKAHPTIQNPKYSFETVYNEYKIALAT